MELDTRLPPISAELVLETVGLEVFRDTYGMHQCRERGVGPRRRKLGPAPAFNIPFCAPSGMRTHEELDADARAKAMEQARDQARTILASICELCQHTSCKMKSWGVTAQPS